MQTEVESYLSHRYWPEDEFLSRLRRDIYTFPGPTEVNAEIGKLLSVLVMATGAKRVLELGTQFGYNAICIARALPSGGHLDTIEASPFHADSAAKWFKETGVSKRVQLFRGTSETVLPTLKGLYDLVFLDGDTSRYFGDGETAVRRLRPGGTLVADNMTWSGKVADKRVNDEKTQDLRAFHAFIACHDDLMSTVLPVGDGLSISVKRA